MSPRFSSFHKKNFSRLLLIVFCLLLLCRMIPATRPVFLAVVGFPMALLTTVKHEVDAALFYRLNYARVGELSRQVDALGRMVNQAQEVKLENERMQKLLDFKSAASFKVVAAQVVASSSDNWSSMIMINKGRSSGIRNGYPVITHLGLAGRVVEVSAGLSKAALLSDTNVCVSAICQRNREEGLVCGTLGKYLSMRYLSKESDIQVSDTIVSSGLTERYPKGLLIGTVVEVGDEFSGLSRYATIKPAVNLSNLEEVLVVVP